MELADKPDMSVAKTSAATSNAGKFKSRFNPSKPKNIRNDLLPTSEKTPIPAAITDTDMLELAPMSTSSSLSPSIGNSPSFYQPCSLGSSATSLARSDTLHVIAEMPPVPSSSPSPLGSEIIFSKSTSTYTSLQPTPAATSTNFKFTSLLPSTSLPIREVTNDNHTCRLKSLSRSLPSSQTALFNEQSQKLTLLNATLQLFLPSSEPLPDLIPLLSPSDPRVLLFDGASTNDEHVTVWEPCTGKTVAGNAAPYRRNLRSWLCNHPGWEEKSDEYKSSKRRSAARHCRSVALAFSASCCYPSAVQLAIDAAHHLGVFNYSNNDSSAMSSWTTDDFVRLQELLIKATQQVHKNEQNKNFDFSRWASITTILGGSKLEPTVIYCSLYMLMRGIAKSLSELETFVSSSTMATIGHPLLPVDVGSIARPPVVPPALLLAAAASIHDIRVSVDDCPVDIEKKQSMASSSTVHDVDSCRHARTDNLWYVNRSLNERNLTAMPAAPAGAAAVLERSRAPREPRVTVWNPVNRRTISGNAAPGRRNLQTWMKQHPGWFPKEERQLSSSRRNRNRLRSRTSLRSGSTMVSASSTVISPKSEPNQAFRCTDLNGDFGSEAQHEMSESRSVEFVRKELSKTNSAEPESPHFIDALEGLLVLSQSPHVPLREGVMNAEHNTQTLISRKAIYNQTDVHGAIVRTDKRAKLTSVRSVAEMLRANRSFSTDNAASLQQMNKSIGCSNVSDVSAGDLWTNPKIYQNDDGLNLSVDVRSNHVSKSRKLLVGDRKGRPVKNEAMEDVGDAD